jgi:hypothetical protein
MSLMKIFVGTWNFSVPERYYAVVLYNIVRSWYWFVQEILLRVLEM